MEEYLSPREAKSAADRLEAVIENVEQVILGKHEVVSLVIAALLAQGHILLEDVPGVGKTSLVSAVAASIGCGFRRIQFTPDLMPSDVTGFSVYNQRTGLFEFRPGAVMSNLILADELNRASAKTQAALLECMQERQVTADGKTYPLEEPFLVMATQNPADLGTYPLPESELDRFMMKISIGYPDRDAETRLLLLPEEKKKSLSPVMEKEELRDLINQCRRVRVMPVLASYTASLMEATRNSSLLEQGCSPRGGIQLLSAARAWAVLNGREYVLPEDIRRLAPDVLSHRIRVNRSGKRSGKTEKDAILSILEELEVPTYIAHES